MKSYLVTTGALFAVLAVIHFWETIASWQRLGSDPGFFWMPALGLVAAAFSVWAWRLLRATSPR
jgi:hypothetical protein